MEMVKDCGLQIPIEEIRLIAQSMHLPVDDRELFSLGEYIDAYEAGLITDYVLYVQARVKARAYIALQLTARIRWDSGRGGAIADMTTKLRDQLLNAAKRQKRSVSVE
jgi:hypothetical protein